MDVFADVVFSWIIHVLFQRAFLHFQEGKQRAAGDGACFTLDSTGYITEEAHTHTPHNTGAPAISLHFTSPHLPNGYSCVTGRDCPVLFCNHETSHSPHCSCHVALFVVVKFTSAQQELICLWAGNVRVCCVVQLRLRQVAQLLFLLFRYMFSSTASWEWAAEACRSAVVTEPRVSTVCLCYWKSSYSETTGCTRPAVYRILSWKRAPVRNTHSHRFTLCVSSDLRILCLAFENKHPSSSSKCQPVSQVWWSCSSGGWTLAARPPNECFSTAENKSEEQQTPSVQMFADYSAHSAAIGALNLGGTGSPRNSRIRQRQMC